MEANNNEVREAIKELPLQARASAIALKNIFDQIKSINIQEQKQIEDFHRGFLQKFKVLEEKASEIIVGRKINPQDLGDDPASTFFTEEEKQEKEKALGQVNRIENYWQKAIANSVYGDDLSEQDSEILKSCSDIRTNVTAEYMELIFTVESNTVIEEGKFSRRLKLDNATPTSYEGDEPKWKVDKVDGLLSSFLLVNTQSENDLQTTMEIVSSLVTEIIPYSLEYYLGAIQNVEASEGEENEDEGDDEIDEEGAE